jgi:hypothetical protein
MLRRGQDHSLGCAYLHRNMVSNLSTVSSYLSSVDILSILIVVIFVLQEHGTILTRHVFAINDFIFLVNMYSLKIIIGNTPFTLVQEQTQMAL